MVKKPQNLVNVIYEWPLIWFYVFWGVQVDPYGDVVVKYGLLSDQITLLSSALQWYYPGWDRQLSGFPICMPCLDVRQNPTFLPMEGVYQTKLKFICLVTKFWFFSGLEILQVLMFERKFKILQASMFLIFITILMDTERRRSIYF